jgi:hypothetical protein
MTRAVPKYARSTQVLRRDVRGHDCAALSTSYAVGAAITAAHAAREKGRVATALRSSASSRLKMARTFALAADLPTATVRSSYYDALVWALYE